MKIEYAKKAVKYINSSDKSTKKRLKEAIEKIPHGDIKKFIPEDDPLPDEIKSINEAKDDILKHGTTPHDQINWD